MADELIETGVSAIEYRVLPKVLRNFEPFNGTVKWFRDELDQLWTKFSTEDDGVITDHVIPATSVAEVRYRKSPK
jgi:hypothetical protein